MIKARYFPLDASAPASASSAESNDETANDDKEVGVDEYGF